MLFRSFLFQYNRSTFVFGKSHLLKFGSDSQATGVTLMLSHMTLSHTKKLEIILVTVFLQSIDTCVEHDMVKAKVNH